MNSEEVKTLVENSTDLKTTYLGTRESQMGTEENVGISDENRLLNVMNIGPIGHGKTQMMVHAALEDIQKDRGLCFVTPKGDAIDQILAKMPEDRLDDVIYLNPNQDPVTKINVLEPHLHGDMTRAQMENQREIIKSDMVDLFRRQSKEWGDRFGRVLETLLRAHIDLNMHRGESNTLLDVYEALVSDDEMQSLIDRTDDQYVRNQLVRIKDLSHRELDPLHRRLDDFVMNDTVQRVIDVDESSVDFHEVVKDGKIVLVDVQKGDIGSDAAQLVGSVVLTQLWAASQARISLPEEERDPFFLFVDEVHNFAGEGSNFAKILAEAREYGLGLWLASQYLNQLEPEMRRSITNNCRTKIFFNPSGSEDISKIAGMLQGVNRKQLTSLGKFRAVMQQPSSEHYNGAVTFSTFPPWEASRGEKELEQIKLDATVADEEESGEHQVDRWIKDKVGKGKNAGDYEHARLLELAKEYLEKRPEVEQVNILHQEPGMERPDGEVIKTSGVANLEAEVSTLSKPAKVLTNLKRAVENDRKCIFIAREETADILENIISDPVNRRGDTYEDDEGGFDYYRADGVEFTDIEKLGDADYRVLSVTDEGGVRDYGTESAPDCPELEDEESDSSREELESFCVHREEDGRCTLLGTECVVTGDD